MLFRNLTLFRFPASMQAAWIDLMAATFALMSGELRLLLDRLDAIFCLSEAE